MLWVYLRNSMRCTEREAACYFSAAEYWEKPLSKVITTSVLPTRLEGAVKKCAFWARGHQSVERMCFLPLKGKQHPLWEVSLLICIICMKAMAQWLQVAYLEQTELFQVHPSAASWGGRLDLPPAILEMRVTLAEHQIRESSLSQWISVGNFKVKDLLLQSQMCRILHVCHTSPGVVSRSLFLSALFSAFI